MGVKKFIILLSCKHSDQLITPKSVSVSTHNNSLGLVGTKKSEYDCSSTAPDRSSNLEQLEGKLMQRGFVHQYGKASEASVGTMMVTKAITSLWS